MATGTIEDILGRYGGQKSALIAMLQDIQERYNYLPEDQLLELSSRLGVPVSRAYSLATFYRAFSLKPRGRHPVSICMGTACHVKGAVRFLRSSSGD